MEPTRQFREVRIFVAAPSDVTSERAKVKTVADQLKPIGDRFHVKLEVVDWGCVAPDMGLPEAVILRQLPPATWDLFVGILWDRFGTPTGLVDKTSQESYLSGTQQEFAAALALFRSRGAPRIMMYRCMRPVNIRTQDLSQSALVREFFANFEGEEGTHPGLYRIFETTADFEDLLRIDLQRALLESFFSTAPDLPALQRLDGREGMLPPRGAFFGRLAEVQRVTEALKETDRSWGVVIDGIGGIGKTSLAIEVAHRCQQQFGTVVFVSAKQSAFPLEQALSGPRTLDGILNALARSLGQTGIESLPASQRWQAICSHLQHAKALLIIDNLESMPRDDQERLDDCLRKLPASCKAIVTTRRRIWESASRQRLREIDDETGMQIVKHIAGELFSSTTPMKWEQLVRVADGSPLALTSTLELMIKHTDRFTIDLAIDLLRDGAASYPELIKFIFEEAQQQLGFPDRALLLALSFFESPASVDALTFVTQMTDDACHEVLERLDARSLVNTEGLASDHRYSLHGLTRTFVRQFPQSQRAQQRVMQLRFAEYWKRFAWDKGGWEKGRFTMFPQIEEQLPNLLVACRLMWELAVPSDQTSDRDRDAAHALDNLAAALGGFLVYTGYWDDRIRISAWAYDALKPTHCNPIGAAWRAYDVAWVYYQRGTVDEVTKWAERCTEAASLSGRKEEKMISARINGLCHWMCGQRDEAKRELTAALHLAIDMDKGEDTARLLNDLGSLACVNTEFDEAGRYIQRALELTRQRKDDEGLARCFVTSGWLAYHRRHWSHAEDWFTKALELGQQMNRINIIGEAFYGLACKWDAWGNPEKSIYYVDSALRILERLRHRRRADAYQLKDKVIRDLGGTIKGP